MMKMIHQAGLDTMTNLLTDCNTTRMTEHLRQSGMKLSTTFVTFGVQVHAETHEDIQVTVIIFRF
jgi:hypothetical protein